MPPIRRRDFLQLMMATAGGAVLFEGCGLPEHELQVQSVHSVPPDAIRGPDSWYASVCRQCSAGCGIIVRVMEGRAKKIEGNPDYPVNQGKLCVRGQAGLQALYHPDRIAGPLRRVGDRFTGSLEPISWDQGLDLLLQRLRQVDGRNAILLTEPLNGTRSQIAQRFASAYGAVLLPFAPLEQGVLAAAMKQVFKQDVAPEFDIANARYLLSFGADLFETWQSPVRYSRAYGEFRQGRSARGTFVQVEPRLSMTAASADRWIPINPGTEGVLALSLAQVIIAEGRGDAAAAQALTEGRGAAALAAFAPEQAAQQTGVPADRIRTLAREFAATRPALAVGGGSAGAHTNGLFNLAAIYSLNYLVGSVGQRGGVRFNPAPAPDAPRSQTGSPSSQWQQLAAGLTAGSVQLLLVHGANPVYGTPTALKLESALRKIPFIVSFSSFMDETTALADLVLPSHTYLEDWGDDRPNPGPGYQTVGFQQPAVNPFLNTRSFVDVLLTVGQRLGGQVAAALPWATHYDALRQEANALFELKHGSVRADTFEGFWNGSLQRGGWWDVAATGEVPTPTPPPLPTQARRPEFDGGDADYPFHLLPFQSNSLGEGQLAHLPWLQAAPDPITTVVWRTWVEINPAKARELKVSLGDIVTIESSQGSIEAPVYIHPGIAPGVVAIPVGQGHTAYTQYAQDRGANVLSILAPKTEQTTGALAWAATRVRVRPTGRRLQLPRLEGHVTPVLEEHAPFAPLYSAAGR